MNQKEREKEKECSFESDPCAVIVVDNVSRFS